MENINFFLTAATEKLGVSTVELFQTVDLYEAANMTQVLWGITAVARYVSLINTIFLISLLSAGMMK